MARYSWKLLRAGPIWLDGGGMFGVVPRVIWSKAMPPDELGRIQLAHNCLLLESVDSPKTRVLIEAGSGDKFDAKMRGIYGLTDRTVAKALEEAGVSCEAIDHAIVSHLHFDHVGGLTKLDPGGGVALTFPRADIHVQKREWEDANAGRAVMTRTYLPENLELLKSKLKLIESPAPFEAGRIPDRREIPEPLEERMSQVLPGIFAFLVPGHTWGQQAIGFVDEQERTIVFTPDVMPTVHHVGAAYNLGYDVEPYTSTVTRYWFLAEAAKRDWVLILDHEPGDPCVRIREDGKGWFTLEKA